MASSAQFTQVGPGTPAGTVLRQHWQPVARSADVAPGGLAPLRILGEELTLYRGEGGTPHLVGGRCAHRSTTLHTGWVEGDCVRCFYHGWAYNEAGQCVEQPAEDAAFRAKVRIPAYPVQEYAGLIFAYLGAGTPPPLPHYPELDAPGIKHFGGIRPPGVWPINYFQILENDVDPVHTSFVHRASSPRLRAIPEVRVRETDYGIEVTSVRGAYERSVWFHFPNLLHVTAFADPEGTVEFDHFLWAVPVDDEHSLFLSSTALPEHLAERYPRGLGSIPTMWGSMSHTDAQALLSGARRPTSVTEEDYVAMVGQGTVVDRSVEHLGRSDVAIILLRRLWLRAFERLEAPQAEAAPSASDFAPSATG